MQRSGRAGRLFPGTVFRFYSEPIFRSMDPYDSPEILRVPLASTVLRLKITEEEAKAQRKAAGLSLPAPQPSRPAAAAAIKTASAQTPAGEQCWSRVCFVGHCTDTVLSSLTYSRQVAFQAATEAATAPGCC